MVVPSHQTATAPPPVSVAVSVVGGDEVTMVLTDHDYAPMRDNNGEGVMFLITQPTEQTEEHDVKCPVSGPELPVLEKEPPPPELIAESPCALPTEIKYSNIPPVLTRESIIPHAGTDTVLSVDEEIISDSVVSERNTDDVMIIEEIPLTTEGSIQKLTEGSNNQETQVEHVEGLDRCEGDTEEMRTDERNQEVEVIVTGSVEDLCLKETSTTKEGIIQEQKEQEAAVDEEEEEEEGEGEDEDDDIDDEDETKQASTMKTYSPIKKPVASNVPIRRQPPVQMADIMKEWDDFDDDDVVEDHSSEPFHQSESEIKPVASEGEPKVLRGPVCGEQ
jgi:hypothetical protein